MKYRVHPEAEAEAEEAAEWYGAQVPALAIEFARQYALAIDWIAENPKMYAPADDAPPNVECRNMLRLGRFPYRVVYALIGDEIYVVAVAHHNRKPGYWQSRITDPPPETT